MATQKGQVIFMPNAEQMKSVLDEGSKLEIVDPFAEPEPIEEPVEEKKNDFSWKLREKIKAPNNPMENVVRYRAQSFIGELLPYEQALDIVRWLERTPQK